MKPPDYTRKFPDGVTCPKCGEWTVVVPLMNEFDYTGTHCNGGRPGTHYPTNWGEPVSRCCEAPIKIPCRYESVCAATWEEA